MDKKVVVQGPSLGLGMVLFIVFLVLKLVGVINWSWWWVTCPLWIPLVIAIGMVLFVLGAFLLVYIINKIVG